MGESFKDLINQPEEVRRILDGYVFKENPNIKDFGDFEIAFRTAFNSPKGENSSITTDTILGFFQTDYAKKEIGKNLTDKEYDEVYGDGTEVIYTSPRDRSVKVVQIPRVKSKGYQKGGKTIKPYLKTKQRAYSPAETKFILVRKQKGLKPKQISSEYNRHFSNNPRTTSSIKSKVYRV